MDNLKEKITQLEKEIADLPPGYISKKTINGKIRQYHQWTEDGKKKSKYLNDEAATVMTELIEKRRILQQELKKTKALLPKLSLHTSFFKTEILTGDNLKLFALRSAKLKSRPCLKKIQDFLS